VITPAAIIKSLHKAPTPRAITADEAAVIVRDGTADEIMIAYLSMNLETPDEIRQQMRQAMRSAK
jgi:hypothetical protein